MTKQDCVGCSEDFYNGKNDIGVAQCWSFDASKKCVTRYRLSVDTPMDQKSGYQKVSVPPCYRKTRFVHLDQIPNYAK